MKGPSLKGSLAVLILASIFLSLTALGVAAIATQEPLPRWSHAGTLSELVPGGPPVRTLVTRIHRDHWVRYPDEPIASVHLRRTVSNEIVALGEFNHGSACPVVYLADRQIFQSCCYGCTFDLNGKTIQEPGNSSWCWSMPRYRVKIVGDQVFLDLNVELNDT